MIIYKITNKINGKIYIGKTEKSLIFRWKNHLRCAENKVNRYLYDAMNHYGSDNFIIEEIEKCNTKEELIEQEKYWIKFLDSMNKNRGYNMQEGGIGGVQPLEVRLRSGKKISIVNKGHKVSQETRLKLSLANKGKTITTEQRLKMSKSRMGKKPSPSCFTPEANAKRKESRMKTDGYKHSPETKLKLSKNKIGKPINFSAKDLERRRKCFVGRNNPMFKEIDTEQLKLMIDNRAKVSEVAHYFNVSAPTIISKFKTTFGKTIEEYRGRLGGWKRTHSLETKNKIRFTLKEKYRLGILTKKRMVS